MRYRRVDRHHVRPDSAQLRASGLRRPSRRTLAQRRGGRARARPRWLLGLLGLISLGTGYWLSATVKDAGMMILFFFRGGAAGDRGHLPAVHLRQYHAAQGSAQKPALLLQAGPLHQRLSGMIYRMKQNAVGLANVCILSTMVLVMVFSTLSLWLGMEGHPQQPPAFGHRCAVRLHGCVSRTGGRRG